MSNQLQVSGAAKIRSIQGPVVANSGVITALDGDASQYVRGDGTLADFPTSTGGGSSVSYYLNTSVSQGTIGGVAYKQLSKTPISGAGTDITTSANGYIASYITDANDPALLEVPAGNFNCEFYFSVNSNAHNPYFYAELYKYDGTTFTLLGSSQSVPEYLTNGTTISPYYFAIPVATAVLTITDRIAIKIYVNVDTRTVTLHTENNHLCQVVTTFSKGLISLNNLTRQNQFFQTGTSGTDFNISSTTATHTFNIPDASATNRGLITTGTQTIAGLKTITGTSLILAPSAGDGGILNLKRGAYTGGINDYTSITSQGDDLSLVSLTSSTNRSIKFDFSSITSGILRTYTLPNASGTLALTSNLSSYVPYTGATADVNLGTFSITGGIGTFTNGVLNGNGSNPANLYLKKGSAPFFTNAANYGLIAAVSSSFILISDVDGTNYKYASFNLGSLTNNTNRAYTLPDASGTIALTSNLSSYLPLAGGTLTGVLNGTTAAFSDSGTSINTNLISLLQPNLTAYNGPILTLGKAIGINNAAAIQFYYTSSGSSSNSLILALYGSTGLTIYGNGNGSIAGSFGIGTTSPSYTLDVSGTGRFTGALNVNLTSAASAINLVNTSTNNIFTTYSNASNNTYIGLIGNNGVVQTNNDFEVYTGASYTKRLTITSAGYINIGNNIAQLLPISTTNFQILNGYIYDGTNLIATATTGSRLIISGGTFQFSTFSGATIGSSVTDTERMRITSGGDVQVQGTSSNAKIILFRNYSNSQPGISVYNTSNTEILYFNGNTGDLGITGQGYKPGGGSWANSSDIRLKENVKTIENALDKVMQLRGVTFDWKQGYTENGKKESGGFIADEVMEVFPDWVSETNATEAQKEIVNDEKIKSLSLPFSFDALLVQAIKEQQIQIQNLQEQINILAK